MSTKNFRSVRLLPKDATELNILTGSSGEVFFDSFNQTLRVYNGTSSTGIQMLRSDLSNISTAGGLNVNFGSKILQAGGFAGPLTGAVTGNVTGNVTGQVSDISNHALGELSNVSVGTVSNGQVLYYNGVTSKWQPTTLTSSFNGGTITTALKVDDSTASGTFSTGALVVTGGLGVGGSINSGGGITGDSITVNSAIVNGSISNVTGLTAQTVTATTGISVNNRGTLRLYNTGTTKYLALRAPTAITANTTWTLPDGDGTANQVLQTDGAGNLGWVNLPTGGGGGGVSNPPGGSTGYIQYNGGSSTFAGSTNLKWVTATSTFTTVNMSATGDLDVQGTITGAISGDVTSSNAVITGGSIDGTTVGSTSRASGGFTTIGVSSTATFDDTTNATSTTVAGVVVAGGIGVAQDAIIGGSISVNNSLNVTNEFVAGSNVVIATKPTLPTHATNKKYVDSRALALSIALGG